MSHAGRRAWRLFYLALTGAMAVTGARTQNVPLTTVSDTGNRADGNPAAGTLLISWPAFTTSDGHAVAAVTRAWCLECRRNSSGHCLHGGLSAKRCDCEN